MVGIWVGCAGRVLAGDFVHSSSKPRNDDTVWVESGEFKGMGISHDDENGEWAFRRRRVPKSFLFS